MTQIIKTSTPGQERTRLSKAIIITIREFMRHSEPDKNTRDMIAFIILALKQISEGIDQSVAAWEKRGYWVKADKYRMEWQWTGLMVSKLDDAFIREDWGAVAQALIEIMRRFNTIKVSDQHRMGRPWVNAYKEYQKQNS